MHIEETTNEKQQTILEYGTLATKVTAGSATPDDKARMAAIEDELKLTGDRIMQHVLELAIAQK